MAYMEYIQTHLSINRVLLLTIGLWPYQQSNFIRVQCFLLFGILTTFILAQLGVFFTSRCTADVVLKILFSVSFFAISVVNYASFYVNIDAVKYLTDQIQYNYAELKDKNEIAIMDEYGNKTKRFTAVLTTFLACCLFSIYWMQFWPRILDVILPANETRPIHMLHFANEYFLHQEKHFYLMQLHVNATLCICGFTMVGTGMMLLAYAQHICGMFRIARFAEFLMSTFAIWIFLLIAFGVISTSFNLIRIFLLLSSRYDMEELILQFLLLAVQYFYMFMANFVAQEVMDHNNHVFTNVYNIQWYMAPLRIQNIILFLLQRGTKVYNLHLSSLFVGSLEGFATLMTTSISYFTVIYSAQQ